MEKCDISWSLRPIDECPYLFSQLFLRMIPLKAVSWSLNTEPPLALSTAELRQFSDVLGFEAVVAAGPAMLVVLIFFSYICFLDCEVSFGVMETGQSLFRGD